MNSISLICCLLALSSSAYGRSPYGSYSSAPLTQMPSVSVMRDLTSQQQQQPFSSQLSTQTGYGQQPQTTGFSSSLTQGIQQDTQPQQPISSGYGSSFGVQQFPRKQSFIQADQTLVAPQTYNKQQFQIPTSRVIASPQQLLFDQQQQLQQKIQESQIVTEADVLCRGQRAETVLPLDNGRRFVVCLDEGKGFEQSCPKGLYYHTESRRCERKLGPLENPCSSQPCLNNGQCVQTDVSSYQCQCQQGFDGKTCELDATVCHSQQPCGQSPDARCQSFRLGAALQHICILQNGAAYGLSAQQAQPSPCTGVDGPQPLAFSDKGFIMCDGESMFVESCPGGTVWDDLNKACVWPDMQGVVGVQLADQSQKSQGYSQQVAYGSVQRPMNTQYGGQVRHHQRPVQLEQPKIISSYSQIPMKSSYGSQLSVQQPQTQQIQFPQQEQMRFPQQDQQTSSYGSQQQIQLPQQQIQLPQQQIQLPQQDQTEQIQIPQTQTSSYGSQQQFQQPMTKPQIWQQPIQRQQDMRLMQQQQPSAY
jgi:hypothetical protein